MQNNRRINVYVLAAGAAILLIASALYLISSHKSSSIPKEVVAQQTALAASPYADPILKYLPYGDIGYNISPTLKTIDSKHVLTLKVDIILDDSDYRSSPAQLQSTINAHEKSALDYIRSKGLDPSKYRIEYNVPPH